METVPERLRDVGDLWSSLVPGRAGIDLAARIGVGR
jgi:hypothetical protein